MKTFVGCAGWSVPKTYAAGFPDLGSHLERYASRFNGVEINSSFYRPHQVQTYAKWAASVPASFRFAVKIPKAITHENRLKNPEALLQKFLMEVAGLGEKLGPLLVQLPPSLPFQGPVANQFFSSLRELFSGQVVCEPRHPSWFAPGPHELLNDLHIARVAADPAPVAMASELGGWPGLAYHRLHGSPTIYRSAYSYEFLEQLTGKLQGSLQQSIPTWCIFDNTAEGEATGNALEITKLLGE